MKIMKVHEVKTHLSRILSEVDKGEEYIIARALAEDLIFVTHDAIAFRYHDRDHPRGALPRSELPVAAAMVLTARRGLPERQDIRRTQGLPSRPGDL